MGAVNSRMDGAFVQSGKRFNIKEITAHSMEEDDSTNELTCGRLLLRAEFDKDAERPTLSRPDGRPVEYVETQDLFMPKLPGNTNIAIKFRLSLAMAPNAPFRNVTFVTGSTRREVDSFISTELLENPNIQNEDNVDLLGDFVCRSDAPDVVNHTFVYPLTDYRRQGKPIHYSFCEYVKSNHSLQPLASGFFYLSEREFSASQIDILSPDNTLSPVRDLGSVPGLPGLPATAASGPSTAFTSATSTVNTAAQNAPSTRTLGPQLQHADQLEDGPLFRSKIAAMERRNAQVKAQVKIILKRAIVMHEQIKETADSLRWFMSGLSNAAKSGVPSLHLMDPIINDRAFGMLAGRNLLLTISAEFAALVLTPLRDFYERDIKPLEFRKKEFEEESSQYYSWMTRYLSTKRERRDKENDAKYIDKRTSFELVRFDYYNALLDVHGGKRLEQFVCQIANFSQRWVELASGLASEVQSSSKNSIELLADELKQANKDWARYTADREDVRRGLESGDGFDQSTSYRGPVAAGGASAAAFAPLEEDDDEPEEAPHKEGLLWALSRPGGISEAQNLSKQGIKWHKYWVVQDGGKLWEYANWKQGLDLHNEPIDLKVARVREASPADRRFCFEIVTPSYKRVYQATSEEDVKSWLAFINKGISSSLENFQSNGTPRQLQSPLELATTPHELSVSKPRETIEKLGENIGRKLSLKTTRRNTSTSMGTPMGSSIAGSPNSSVLSPSSTIYASAPAMPPKPTMALLSSLQKAPSNRQCAECETTRGVEWVSINLLVVLCIECSGSHRSLGSHISKVRSLTLDTVSFTKDLVEALSDVSNSSMNAVWEAALRSKPAINDRNRLQFITEKYVEKAYIQEIDKPNAYLRRAIAEQNIVDVCTALAARANPNSASDDGEPLLVYALRCAPSDATTFAVAEVLLLNRATVPTTVPADLSTAAQYYLRLRQPS